MTDARVIRTRSALHEAVADLATDTSVAEVTVSQLAETAGINRATFYNHFDAPADVLASLLASELDPIRDELYSAIDAEQEDPRIIFQNVLEQILAHVESHRAIYDTSFKAPAENTAQHVLADHLTDSFRGFLASYVPHTIEYRELDDEVLASFYAHGFVGAIQAWLREESVSREAMRHTVLEILPSGWFPPRA